MITLKIQSLTITIAVKLFSFNAFCDSFDAIAFTIIVWIFLLLFSENVHVVCKLFQVLITIENARNCLLFSPF